MMSESGALQRSFFTGFYVIRVKIMLNKSARKEFASNLYLIGKTEDILIASVGEYQLDHGVCCAIGTCIRCTFPWISPVNLGICHFGMSPQNDKPGD